MLKKVEKFIIKNRLISPHDAVLVGLSGGPDSVALLHCLYLLKDKIGFRLASCHLNHHIRGKDAYRDAKLAHAIAGKFNIPFYSGNADIPAIKRKRGGTVEEVARDERYQYFRKIAVKCRANKIALGHTADDTVETFIFNLLRGTGIRGLSGIPVKRNEGKFEIIRPLLGIPKSEILKYLSEERLPYCTDATNLDDTYTRNKIRHRLLPYLKKQFNPNISQTILNTSIYLRESNDYIQGQIDRLYAKIISKTAKGFSIPQKKLKTLHPAIRKLLLRRFFEDEFNFTTNNDLMESIDSILKGKKERHAVISNNIMVSLEYGILKFIKLSGGKNKLRPLRVKIPSKNFFPDWNIKVETSVLNADRIVKKSYIAKKPPFGKIWQKVINIGKPLCITEYFDADVIGRNMLIIRSKKDGDKYKPLGQDGSRSLKKLFIDEKIPITLKEKIPVFTVKGNIFYVAGHRIAESAKITERTKKALKLSLTIFPL